MLLPRARLLADFWSRWLISSSDEMADDEALDFIDTDRGHGRHFVRLFGRVTGRRITLYARRHTALPAGAACAGPSLGALPR